jgi:DNA end-binding protein Ku
MARPLWKGTLSFGLVSIPVEVHSAVRDLGPHFHFLRKSDQSRIGFQKVAKNDGQVVSAEELVKGYEYEKGRYVVLTPQDFAAAAVKRNSRIDLLDFVTADEVDDRYFDTPYYLLPAAGGEPAYALLREALRQSNRVGIAKFVMRDKPHLAAVEAIKDALVLSTMRFREELVSSEAFSFPTPKLREPELKMAQQLVEALVAPWDPDKYTDEYRANLQKLIEAKQKDKTPDLERQEVEADSNVVDLMERLRRSLGQRAGQKPDVARAAGRKAARKDARGATTRKATARKTSGTAATRAVKKTGKRSARKAAKAPKSRRAA